MQRLLTRQGHGSQSSKHSAQYVLFWHFSGRTLSMVNSEPLPDAPGSLLSGCSSFAQVREAGAPIQAAARRCTGGAPIEM